MTQVLVFILLIVGQSSRVFSSKDSLCEYAKTLSASWSAKQYTLVRDDFGKTFLTAEKEIECK